MSNVRVRFAPSPTGNLHVGGARTALFSYFYAKRYGGKFILRIEDTDTARGKKEYEEEILRAMQWLGLSWDEGPFYQTQRFDLYRSYVQELLDSGHAYRCYCTKEELEEMRAKAQATHAQTYDRRWRDHKGPFPDRPFAVRFKTPLTGVTVVKDAIHGDVTFQNSELDDFIILRSQDGPEPPLPTYNMAVVADDVDMRITHVIRGDDHLSNTPKQVLIMQALGFPLPVFAHVPMILGPDKAKLSKRHGATAVSQYGQQGFLPEAMVNYLVKLGWAHGDQELFTRDELAKVFDLDGCGSSAAVFDRTKLTWMNGQYLRKRSKESVLALLKENHGQDLAKYFTGDVGDKLWAAAVERAELVTDIPSKIDWLSKSEPLALDPDQVEKVLSKRKPGVVEAVVTGLQAIPESAFTIEACHHVIQDVVAKTGSKFPDVGKPLRVLLTGGLSGPDLSLMCAALGKNRTLARLANV